MKKIISEKVTLKSERNQNWKNVTEETEQVNKLLKYIPTDNSAELNELIYEGIKRIGDEKKGIPQRNPNRNIKPGWQMRIERQIKKLRQDKFLKKINGKIEKNPKKTTADKSDN